MKKNYGIEALRILSMIMVVVLHILGQGGVLKSTAILSPSYNVAWFLEIMSFCAVDTYALITGYLLINSEFKISRFVKTWSLVLSYSIGITMLGIFVMPEYITKSLIIKSFLVTIGGMYWYFTAYVGIIFLAPFINRLLKTLEEVEFRKLLILCFVLFSLLPAVFILDTFRMQGGYTLWWLIFMYMIGAYINLHRDRFNLKSPFTTFLISSLLVLISKIAVEAITIKLLGTPVGGQRLISYTSPLIILNAVCLFLFFENLTLNQTVKKIISIVAPLSFAVYIIHLHPIIWKNYMHNGFVFLCDYPAWSLFFIVPFCAILIFASCAIIEYIRINIFKVFKIDSCLMKLTTMLEKQFMTSSLFNRLISKN